jgi:small subunit ribosomal protein S16
MLAIRMRRVGSKKRPFFRLVVARSEAARDGSFLEILGSYYPRAKPAKVEVDRERVDYWVSKGARPSDTVRTLIARHLPAAAPAVEVAPAAPAPRPAAPVAEPPAAVQAHATPELDAGAVPAPAPVE